MVQPAGLVTARIVRQVILVDLVRPLASSINVLNLVLYGTRTLTTIAVLVFEVYRMIRIILDGSYVWRILMLRLRKKVDAGPFERTYTSLLLSRCLSKPSSPVMVLIRIRLRARLGPINDRSSSRTLSSEVDERQTDISLHPTLTHTQYNTLLSVFSAMIPIASEKQAIAIVDE
jgi:hypothetical protein